MLSYFDLSEQVAIVTGGSQGIGFTLAKTLASAGAEIVIVNRRAPEGEAAAQSIRQGGGSAISIPADISQKKSVEEMVGKTLDRHGKIDVLVNDAGVIFRRAAEETEEKEWNLTMDINLKGLFFCCQAVGKQMIKQERGKIINLSSVGATFGLNNRAAYNASKAGISQLTKSLALEWARHGIYVNAIGPGIVRTTLNAAYIDGDPGRKQKMIQKIPLGRFGRPEDLSGIVLFLASSASDYLTGQTIYVDGGYTLGCLDW